ncbi:putative stress up-regulated Nod 19 [Tanacetum coccineum]
MRGYMQVQEDRTRDESGYIIGMSTCYQKPGSAKIAKAPEAEHTENEREEPISKSEPDDNDNESDERSYNYVLSLIGNQGI